MTESLSRSLVVTNGVVTFTAPILLPTGAVLRIVEVYGCDNNPAGEIAAVVRQCSVYGGCTALAEIRSGVAATIGCGGYQKTFFQPFPIVDNSDSKYLVEVTLSADNAATSLNAVRAVWQRDVSPAPGAATFGDVPVGSPFHRFVEALVHAGITAGCGNGNYCPDVAISRGQMAVFIAIALGIHWPN